jgi:RHS repeat-associated protein
VGDQRWVDGSTGDGADVDRLKYGHDRNSNPLYKQNLLASGHSEVFTYDGLDRMQTFKRGSISFSGGLATIASPTRSQDWTLDAVGNWASLSTDGSAVARTHDRQNRLTAVAGSATTLTYDNNGNQTRDESNNTLVYDGWNRLVGWTDPNGTGRTDDEGLAYPYDALHRRVARQKTTTLWDPTQPTRYVTSLDGRVLYAGLDNTVDGSPTSGYHYVYSAVDPMTLVARDVWTSTQSGGGGGGWNPAALTGRVYARQDVIGNTTSTVQLTLSGSTVTVGQAERYELDPYGGNVRVLESDFSADADNASDIGWQVFFQGGFTDPLNGLIHFGAREYDPDLGRWLQQDPIGWPDGANRYEAMRSGPGAWVDPGGLSAICTGPGMNSWVGDGHGAMQELGLGGTESTDAAIQIAAGHWVTTDGFTGERIWIPDPAPALVPSPSNSGSSGGIGGSGVLVPGADEAWKFMQDMERKYGTSENMGNAARHLYWMAMVRFRYGEWLAVFLGNEHESGMFDGGFAHLMDSIRDLLNNELGREIGGKAKSESDIPRLVEDAIRQGRAYGLSPDVTSVQRFQPHLPKDTPPIEYTH